MAFCVRSERNLDFNSKEKFPGPGQYIKITPKILLNNKRKFPPFFTSAKRPSFIKLNNIPGPGSYNLNANITQNLGLSNVQMLSTNTSFEKEENNFQELITNYNSFDKNNNLSGVWQATNFSFISKNNNYSSNKSFLSKDKAVQNSNILKLFNAHFNENKFIGTNIGFLSQSNRFNLKKNELNPGPGYYCDSILNTDSKSEKKIKNKLKNGKIFDKAGSLSRVVSIPSKNMNGYIVKNLENDIEKEKEKEKNNSRIKNQENNNNNSTISSLTSRHSNSINNTHIRFFIDNNNTNLMLGSAYNEENKIFNNKFQLLINERKFCNTPNTTTSEFIGPGSYDASLIEKKKKAINWSKGFDPEKISKRNNILRKKKLLEEMKKNGDFNPSLRTFHGKIHKIKPYQNKILLLNSIRKLKSNILQNVIPGSSRSDSFIPDKTYIPGPGYYDQKLFLFNSKKNTNVLSLDNELSNTPKKIPNLNYIKYQFGNNKLDPGFGSKCERPMNKSKSLEDLGPFSYFKDKNKYDPGKKNTIYKNLILGKTDLSRTSYINCDFYSHEKNNDSVENDFVDFDINIINSDIENKNKKVDNLKFHKTTSNFSTDKDNILLRNLDVSTKNFFNKLSNIPLVELDKYKYKYIYNNPGPGDYNISHSIIKPSFSSNSIMSSKTERFKDKLINENPGPGAYQIRENNEKKILIKKICYKRERNDFIKRENFKKIIEKNKRKNEIPGVGYYNIDKRNSLIYKINSKCNSRQGYNSPFLISSSRFSREKNINEVSSGDYEPYKYENIQKNNQYMVFNKADRFNKENDLLVGPGSYDLNPSWNKKSYNKLFTPKKQEILD